MCNIVLNDNLSIRLYFEKVLELVKSGEDFPVNLDDVWPLIYSDKGKAVRVLTGDNGFIKDIDYKVFTQNGKNPVGGRPTIVYMISVSCMEYLIARKERRVFDVYRSVFHGAVNAFNKMEESVEKNLPHNYIEALEALLASEKEKQALAEAKKEVEEAKISSVHISPCRAGALLRITSSPFLFTAKNTIVCSPIFMNYNLLTNLLHHYLFLIL